MGDVVVRENLLQLLRLGYHLRFTDCGASGSLDARLGAWTLRPRDQVVDAVSDLIAPDRGRLSSRVFLNIVLEGVTPPIMEPVFNNHQIGAGWLRWLEVNGQRHFIRMDFRQPPRPNREYLRTLVEIILRETAKATFVGTPFQNPVWIEETPIIQTEPIMITE